jgi:hypothetical protein
MSTEFVLFRTAGTNEPEPILIKPRPRSHRSPKRFGSGHAGHG